MFCSKCGKKLLDGSNYCSFCGEKALIEEISKAAEKENDENNISETYSIFDPKDKIVENVQKTNDIHLGNETDFKNNDQRVSPSKRIIVYVMISFIAIALLLTICLIQWNRYLNKFETKATDSDFLFTYQIYDDYIMMYVTPYVDMKNVKFSLYYKGKGIFISSHDMYQYDSLSAGETLCFVKPVTGLLTDNSKPESVSFYLTNQLLSIYEGATVKQNKYRNKTVISAQTSKKKSSECSFVFYVVNKKDADKSTFFYSDITNNTDMPIYAIALTASFGSYKIKQGYIEFDTPLKPGEKREHVQVLVSSYQYPSDKEIGEFSFAEYDNLEFEVLYDGSFGDWRNKEK